MASRFEIKIKLRKHCDLVSQNYFLVAKCFTVIHVAFYNRAWAGSKIYGQFYSNLMRLTALFSSYRRSSENIANNPLPPLPGHMEDHFDLESEERRQMLKPEIYGGSSGDEGGIELEEYGNEQAVAFGLTPITHPSEKAGNSKQENTLV